MTDWRTCCDSRDGGAHTDLCRAEASALEDDAEEAKMEKLLHEDALTAAHRAVEDVLVERRDHRISLLGYGNGLVIREGEPSCLVRLSTREALEIGIAAYLKAIA